MKTILLAIALLISVSQASATAPEEFIEQTIDGIFAALSEEAGGEADRRAAVLELLEPAFDFALMAKLTLGKKHWTKLDDAQRKKFSDLFYEQLRSSYADKISSYQGNEVVYEEPIVRGAKAKVPTKVQLADEALDVAYKLAVRDGVWRIYDVEVQGISIIRSYSAQYDEVIRKRGIEGLFTRMRETLEKGAAAPGGPATAGSESAAN